MPLQKTSYSVSVIFVKQFTISDVTFPQERVLPPYSLQKWEHWGPQSKNRYKILGRDMYLQNGIGIICFIGMNGMCIELQGICWKWKMILFWVCCSVWKGHNNEVYSQDLGDASFRPQAILTFQVYFFCSRRTQLLVTKVAMVEEAPL